LTTPSCPAGSIDLGIDTNFVRNCSKTDLHHHETLVGVGTNHPEDCHRIGAVLDVVERLDALFLRTLHALGNLDGTKITSFTDGAMTPRSYLKSADIKALPILEWAHLARRVQIDKTTAKGLKSRPGREVWS
jgi:hypothetical protein